MPILPSCSNRPQELSGLGPCCHERRCYCDEVGDHQDARYQYTNEPDRNDGDGNNAQIARERAPHRLTDHEPERHADDDSDEGHGGRLPCHGGDNLAVHESEHLQEPDFFSAARDTHHKQVEERRGAEDCQHRTKDEREVDRLAEVDQRCWGSRQRYARSVRVEVVVDCSLPLRAADNADEQPPPDNVFANACRHAACFGPGGHTAA